MGHGSSSFRLSLHAARRPLLAARCCCCHCRCCHCCCSHRFRLEHQQLQAEAAWLVPRTHRPRSRVIGHSSQTRRVSSRSVSLTRRRRRRHRCRLTLSCVCLPDYLPPWLRSLACLIACMLARSLVLTIIFVHVHVHSRRYGSFLGLVGHMPDPPPSSVHRLSVYLSVYLSVAHVVPIPKSSSTIDHPQIPPLYITDILLVLLVLFLVAHMNILLTRLTAPPRPMQRNALDFLATINPSPAQTLPSPAYQSGTYAHVAPLPRQFAANSPPDAPRTRIQSKAR